MKTRPPPFNRGFTLVEVMVSMSIGTIVMLAVFSTYLYLGRNLTRLSYQHVLESQSRKILNALNTDLRNTTSVISATASSLTLNTIYVDPITKAVSTATVIYAYGANKLTRDPDGSGPLLPVTLNPDIGDNKVLVPVSMTGFSLLYYATTDDDPVSQFNSTIVPMSIDKVIANFTLQAGDAAIQGQQGTLSSLQSTSGQMLLVNRQLPDGT